MDDMLETKCENLMNIVVESRKRFGKMCSEYELKSSSMENKILNLKIESFSNYRFKPKNSVPAISGEDTKEIEDFTVQLLERQKRIDELKNKLRNTQTVVLQLRNDKIGGKLRQPVDAELMLENAKSKQLQQL
uniref:Uncharacterized protein n=1 Tax=Bombyx mori TaxID=7091 RepID=A0A8R2AMH9_BOMMO|nr:uncharacterized protein LOC101746705 isoform X2 [Bombyx mori]